MQETISNHVNYIYFFNIYKKILLGFFKVFLYACKNNLKNKKITTSKNHLEPIFIEKSITQKLLL